MLPQNHIHIYWSTFDKRLTKSTGSELTFFLGRQPLYMSNIVKWMHLYLAIIHLLAMPATQRLKDNAPLLRLLNKSSPKTQRAIIKECGRDLLGCLCEICLNILKGNVPLSAKEKAQLSKFKDSLRSVSRRSTGPTKKRKILQKGGFLGAILGPLLGSLLKPIAKQILA